MATPDGRSVAKQVVTLVSISFHFPIGVAAGACATYGQRGKGIGIIRIDDSLVDLVKAGRTTLEIAKEWAESPEEIELTVLGKRPQLAPPPQPKAAGEGIFGKAGNIFRKGG